MSVSDNIQSLFHPDPSAIRGHLDQLFRRAEAEYGGRFEIAWERADGHWEGRTYPTTQHGFDLAVAEAVAVNEQHLNVYMGVNPRKPDTPPFGRCSAEDVEIAFHQFVDVDTDPSALKLRRAPLPYTWAVTTGRVPNPRPHAYWALEEPTRNMAAWRQQQAALADYFQTDKVIDPARLLRLAGTVSYPSQKKVERGYRVELVTLRTRYDDDAQRDPVSSEALRHAYPPKPDQAADPQPDPGADRFDTGRKDPREFVRNIAAGHNLHNNARDLVAHLVNTGHRTWLIQVLLDRLLRPVSDGGTLGQIEELIRSARQKYSTPDPAPETEDFDAAPPQPEPPPVIPVALLDPANRKAREWLVPYRMMRRHVTMTTAAPGVGKSTLAIEEAVSMASGIDFLGFGITKPLRVAVINNEETRDELERRIEATCVHFGVPFEAIAERLFLYSGVDNPKMVLVRADRNGPAVTTMQHAQVAALVIQHQFDAVVLDPFVQFHYVEESSNEQISQTLIKLRDLGCGDYPAAIHVIHHNRKPAAGNSHQAGDMASARGASSMGAEAHFFFTLTDMGQDDAEKLNIPEDDRVNFLRLDDAKRKMAPAEGAKWFERYGEMMPYGLMGEEVGVLIPVKKEDLDNTEISSGTAIAILKTIDEAWNEGKPYSEYHQAKGRYVIDMMMREFNMTRPTAKALLNDWLKNEMVLTDTRETHINLNGLRVLKWPG